MIFGFSAIPAGTGTKHSHNRKVPERCSQICVFAEEREVTKELVMEYKHYLIQAGYAVRSVNSMLAGVNSLLCFLGCSDCRVKSLKTQREVYCPESRKLYHHPAQEHPDGPGRQCRRQL